MDKRDLQKIVWETLNFLKQRRMAYHETFKDTSYANQYVLKDLAKFCHWGATPFQPGERETLIFIGRQQVLLRIKQHLSLSDQDLFKLYSGGANPQVIGENDD